MSYGDWGFLAFQRGRVKRGATPMFSGLDAIKKAKKGGQKKEKGRGAMQKKSVFGGDPVRKSGGITPTVLVSHNPNRPQYKHLDSKQIL